MRRSILSSTRWMNRLPGASPCFSSSDRVRPLSADLSRHPIRSVHLLLPKSKNRMLSYLLYINRSPPDEVDDNSSVNSRRRPFPAVAMARMHSSAMYVRRSPCTIERPFSSRIDPRHPCCRHCDTKSSIYWRVPARNVLLCNNCFLNDCKTSNHYCKLKRIDTNTDELSTHQNRLQFPSQLPKDDHIGSSASSSSSSTITKPKRSKPSEPSKPQLAMKISTRQQTSFRSNRKTLAFKSSKVRLLVVSTPLSFTLF